MREFLPVTQFQPGSDYDVQVDAHGVWVNSECCGERMGRDAAEKLRDAITAWLTATCPHCGDEHQPRCRNSREIGDPEWTARELLGGSEANP